MYSWTALLALVVFGSQSCSAQITAIHLGDNLHSGIQQRLLELVELASPFPTQTYPANQPIPSLPAGSLILSFGDTQTSSVYISQFDLDNAGSEGYVIRCLNLNNITTMVVDGNANEDVRYQFGGSIGAGYGSYDLLEMLGFGFLHPLEPFIPQPFAVPSELVNKTESPYWPLRLWHIHTQHPLELTDFLQGLDIVMDDYKETFDEMMPDWKLFLEWMVANRQNQVEWVILISELWGDWGRSAARQDKFREITSVCHEFGIACGADAPLALIQQHSFQLIETFGDLETELADIRRNVDYFMNAGFDFMSTENGFSEFTKADCDKALAWMNEFAIYLDEKYGSHSGIKIHCSTGQTCPTYVDPINGEPLNFNFLPMYADPRLSHFAHTVQMYAIDDPAPTYGNQNFTYMFDFMFRNPEHEQLWYPETAYWVNYDVQVPLFLPTYALSRLKDLRQIARREIAENHHTHGQAVFDSGWEWGYWVQDVVAARAAWNPLMDINDELEALAFSFRPVVAPFGAEADKVNELLVEMAVQQRELMIFGKVNGKEPSDIEKLNGIAYLEGWDTFADIGTKFESFLSTQPARVGLLEVRHRLRTDPPYRQVQPLLAAMDETFGVLAEQLKELRPNIPEEALSLFDDILQGSQMVAIRAKQVYALFDYAESDADGDTDWRRERLAVGRQAIDEAEVIVREREAQYRVPLERIGAWRDGPTVYKYMYLWHVHSLYYFWRDYDKAEARGTDVYSPCYMNVVDGATVGLGEGGVVQNATEAIRKWFDENYPGNHFVVDCLAGPLSEPQYPLDWE